MPGIYIFGEKIAPFLLLVHFLNAVFLLGVVVHPLVFFLLGRKAWTPRRLRLFTQFLLVAYLLQVLLGVFLYPPFRYYVRFLFLDKHYPWATGLFQIKEHLSALGLAILPLYGYLGFRFSVLPTWHRKTFYFLHGVFIFIVGYSAIIGQILTNLKGV